MGKVLQEFCRWAELLFFKKQKDRYTNDEKEK